jgi:serine/threonine-protein kinase
MNEAVPARIGPYPVRGVIGRGSMGVVYLGHDPVIDRPVAIKTIQRQLLEAGQQDHNVAARFRVEAQAAGRLNHRNIVSVYQFGEDGDFAYIVMEFVAGHSVAEYLRRPQPLARLDVLCLMFQLLDALHYAHESGVIHRDIKPANLMVANDGQLKITDFGIARTESSQITRINTVVGSPGYMAPEQYTGGALDRRVDVFSSAVLLYQMLAGSMPFTGADEAIMYQIVYGQHDPLVKRTGDASLAGYDPILERALAKSPAQRFSSALEFRNALQTLDPQPVPALLPRERVLRLVAELPSAAPAVPRETPSVSVTPSRAGSQSVPVPTGWDEAQLADLEREVMVLVGPVGKVLVRRAARGQTDLSTVRDLVAASISDFDLRKRFIAASAKLAGPSSAPRSAPRSGFPDTRPATGRDGSRLQPEDVEKACAVMVRTLGPIAKVLAKQSASQSTTREQFVTQVLNHLSAGVDAERLEADLWRAMS